MTTKAEKLARELISLAQIYSDKDFEKATSLIESGSFFALPVAAARAAKAKKPKKAPLLKKPVVARQPTSPEPSATNNLPMEDLEQLIHEADGSERDRLLEFATKFETGAVMSSKTSTRDFAYSIGVDLPRTLPGRQVIARRFVVTLLKLSKEARARVIDMALRSDDGESSLKRWSDLIVKP